MKNKKAGFCVWCGLRLEPGEGDLRYVDQGDEGLGFGPFGATGWLVSCPDRAACRGRVTTSREAEARHREEARRVDALERELFHRHREFFPRC